MAKRIGLMGCGVVAGYGHLPALASTEGLTLHALFDPNEKNLRAAQEQWNVPHAFTDAEKFFNSGIDAVTITSPAPFHCRNVLDAARHGKHILCEKPLAMTDAECEEMIAAADQAGIVLCTAFDYRYSPVAQQIRSMIREGVIGEVRALRLIYNWNNHGKWIAQPDGSREPNVRRIGRMEEGGPLVDCGVHQIDLARFWLGSEIARWKSAAAWVDEYNAPDHVWLHMDHESGAHTLVEISFSYCFTAKEPVSLFQYELIGTEGVIRYDRNAKLFEVRNNTETRQLEWAGEKNFAGMYDGFARMLATGERGDLPSGHDGRIAASISRQATEAVMAERLQSAAAGRG